MKRKVIVAIVIFILLLISVIYVNSYAQAFSKEERLQVKKEILEQKVEENIITEEQANQIYDHMQEKMMDCDNFCQQNQNCPIYQQNYNCTQQNTQCLQPNNNHMRSCDSRQNCHNRMCNK